MRAVRGWKGVAVGLVVVVAGVSLGGCKSGSGNHSTHHRKSRSHSAPAFGTTYGTGTRQA